MAISATRARVHNGLMNTAKNTAISPAAGRGTVTRISAVRRSSSLRADVRRAQDARRQLRSREERFAHLKRMYD